MKPIVPSVRGAKKLNGSLSTNGLAGSVGETLRSFCCSYSPPIAYYVRDPMRTIGMAPAGLRVLVRECLYRIGMLEKQAGIVIARRPTGPGTWWYEHSDCPVIVRGNAKKGLIAFHKTWVTVDSMKDGWWQGPLVKPSPCQ